MEKVSKKIIKTAAAPHEKAKILFFTVGDETVASTRTRVYGYIPFLKKQGICYKILSFTSKAKCRRTLNLKKDNALQYFCEVFYKIYICGMLLILSRAYDVIFIQKVILPKIIWKALRQVNKKIIFDFDDAIYLWKDIGYILQEALYVIVSNRYLKEYVSRHNANIYEIISPVATYGRTIPRESNALTLGWIGSPETSKYLYKLFPAFRDLKERFANVSIEFMGAKRAKELEALDIKVKEWSLEAEKDYLEKLDVGIMPLEDDEWSRAKAGYKLLLYMSRGIPCVASPVGINMEIIEDGRTGFFANSQGDWLDKLTTLLNDRVLMAKMGEEGRLRAEKYFSYNAVFPEFLKIINSI